MKLSLTKHFAIFHFQYGGHPPSWICLGHIWTIQRVLGGLYRCAKLFVINAAVSIIAYESFNLPCVWLENGYSRPKNWGFGEILPRNMEQQ